MYGFMAGNSMLALPDASILTPWPHTRTIGRLSCVAESSIIRAIMKAMQRSFSRLVFLALLVTALASAHPLSAPGARAQTREPLPPPHLASGVHVAPPTNVNLAPSDHLGGDAVKLDGEGQAALFRGKRILLRMAAPWPENWGSFRARVRQRAASAAAAGGDAIEVHNEPNLAME